MVALGTIHEVLMKMFTVWILTAMASVNSFAGDITSARQVSDSEKIRVFRIFQNQDTGMITVRNCQLDNPTLCRQAPVGGREFTEAELNRAGTILENEIPSFNWIAAAAVGGCVSGAAAGSKVGFIVGYIPGAAVGMFSGCIVGGIAGEVGYGAYYKNSARKRLAISAGIKNSRLVVYPGSAEDLESRIETVLQNIGSNQDVQINKTGGSR
jgi:hypothetical protein